MIVDVAHSTPTKNLSQLDFSEVEFSSRLRSVAVQQTQTLLTEQGHPVAVVQEYGAYQKLLHDLQLIERELHLARTRERLRLMNNGAMTVIPLNQIKI